MDSVPGHSSSAPATSSPPRSELPNLGDILRQEVSIPVPEPIISNRAPVPGLFLPGASQIYIDGTPVKTYIINGVPYNMAEASQETNAEFFRTTVSGRHLKYALKVIQQPQRARACGAGPRSSADRRPVDPPPVVQLKIFEGEGDITMHYDAGFMLYASLEVARPIAQGRMHSGPALPVLTGVAVASAAYLDRPSPAAYFIFPDLSVRHEGWYRLKFSLFESIKHAQDADPDRRFSQPDPNADPRQVIAHEAMANRMEVQSAPFQVYSAKKFPGLNQSTTLSKLVADQGCRVRIRRDIRQRKRNEKPEVIEVADDARSSYRGTPEVQLAKMDHSRSASRNSFDGQFAGERYRRESMESSYGRPVITSRKPSFASLSMSSPITNPSMSMPPRPASFNAPPSVRPQLDMSPVQTYNLHRSSGSISSQPATPIQSMLPSLPRQITPEPSHSLTLPPILPVNLPAVSALDSNLHKHFDMSTKQYNLPEPTASKRSSSPHGYNQDFRLKRGARPDARPVDSYKGLSDSIEADLSANDDRHGNNEPEDGALMYVRADGSTAYKQIVPSRA